MSSDHDLAPIVRSWLEDGATRLPDRVLDSVLDQLPQTQQRRHWWTARRNTLVSNTLKVALATGAIALAVVMGLGLYFGSGQNVAAPPATPTVAPSASPAAVATPVESPSLANTATPSPQGVQYTSERHGYSLLLPDDSWMVEELPGSWPLGDNFNQEGPGADSVYKTASEPGLTILINSQSVPTGTTLEQWVSDYHASSRRWFPGCVQQESETGMVGGEVGQFDSILCSGTERATEALTLHGGRAYVVRVFGIPDLSQDPRPTLDEWLTRFRFTD